MAKSKQPGPALFDLLGPTQEDVNQNLRVPDSHQVEPASPQRETTEPPERAIVPGRQQPVATATHQTPTPDRTTRPRRPLIEFDDECVHVSLTTVRAAVVIMVLLVGLLGVYELGRTEGQSSGYRAGHTAGRASFEADAASEIETARQQAPASHLVEGLMETAGGQRKIADGGPPDNSNQTASDAWIQGYTYVVAQEFAPRSVQDVEAAQAYLRTKGIDTAAIKLDTAWFQLVTTQGFNRSDPVQRDLADRLLAKVHQAGAAYYAGGGGYKLEGYFKTLRKRSWQN